MNISIRGKLERCENKWCLKIGILDVAIECEKPLECLRSLEGRLKEDMGNHELKCFYKVEDRGVFYLVTAQTAEIINFLAERLTNLEDLDIDGNFEDL